MQKSDSSGLEYEQEMGIFRPILLLSPSYLTASGICFILPILEVTPICCTLLDSFSSTLKNVYISPFLKDIITIFLPNLSTERPQSTFSQMRKDCWIPQDFSVCFQAEQQTHQLHQSSFTKKKKNKKNKPIPLMTKIQPSQLWKVFRCMYSHAFAPLIWF